MDEEKKDYIFRMEERTQERYKETLRLLTADDQAAIQDQVALSYRLGTKAAYNAWWVREMVMMASAAAVVVLLVIGAANLVRIAVAHEAQAQLTQTTTLDRCFPLVAAEMRRMADLRTREEASDAPQR